MQGAALLQERYLCLTVGNFLKQQQLQRQRK
jgi:hypothetical protein